MSEIEITRLLFSLVLLLFCSLLFGRLFTYLKSPKVIGEVCAGIALGPSCLGYFWPEIYSWLFNGFNNQQEMLSVFSWLGLILLMFIAGFHLPVGFKRGERTLPILLVLGGIALPMLLGYGASYLIPNVQNSTPIAFSLVIAIACAVTSIPVLSSIFLDLKILDGWFAKQVLVAAAIQDLILWAVLSVAMSAQVGGDLVFGFWDVAMNIGKTAGISIAILIMFPIFLNLVGRKIVATASPESLLGYTLMFCLGVVGLASFFNVNIVFGALLAGMVIGAVSGETMNKVKVSIANFSIWFFIPLYFSITGLKINLPQDFNLKLTLLFFLASSVIKIISVFLFTKFAKLQWKKALDFGITMNARGGPGIVLASIAYSQQIIGSELFVALVLTSLLTSQFTGWWLNLRKDALII